MRAALAASLLAAALPVAAADCAPLETREPNAPGQKPTFAGQTRACAVKTSTPLQVTVVARGLERPWAVEPLPNGDLLVTEKPGRMRIVDAKGQVGPPIAGLPKVEARGQGGLLDVALGPGFAKDRTIFWSYSEPRQGGNGTAVARGVLSQDGKSLSDVRVVFRAMPTYDGGLHFGSRLVFDREGMLFVTLGERSDAAIRPQAQELDSHMGKILRITPEGKPAPGNPFIGKPGALPEIFSLGHRNVQAAALDAQGRLWEVEHGPRGGDEVNLVEKGANYGWPVVTFGVEYSGFAIRGARTHREGFRDPVYYWDPVIAPSGAQFHDGRGIPEWRGNLFVGALRERRLVRLVLDDGRVVGEEHLLVDRNQRIRDVRQGADGALFVMTDDADGEVWKVAPR